VRGSTSWPVWVALAAVLVVPVARGQGTDGGADPMRPRPQLPPDTPSPDEEVPELEDELDLEELERWITLESEPTAPPPLVRAQVGSVFWVDVQSEIRTGRGGVPGTQLLDLENEQGLTASGVSPWIELSIGRNVRGGADLLHLDRNGTPERQERSVVFDGVTLANPGDLIEARFELLTTAGFVEWDPLFGKTYRFGLLGGVRYFRLESVLRGIRPAGTPPVRTLRRRDELVSPFLGGFVELTPFDYLTVSARVQFMNWSWNAVGLKDARYLEFRLGGIVHVVPGLLGVGAEFRYLVVRAESGSDRERSFEGGMAASGFALTLTLAF
jgi:hypothetical protein